MVDDDADLPTGSVTARGPVVVGYNGNEHSRHAVLWAAAEAERQQAVLLVVYAANYPGMTLGPGPGLLEPEPGAIEAAQEVTARGVAEALAAFPDLHVAGATEITSPAEALTEEGARARLVVLGSRGYGRVVGTLLGSVAFAVAAKAPCPVIVVKDDQLDHPVGPRHRVVVGTDGSLYATAAVRFAADRASSAAAALEVVTCTGEHPTLDAEQLRASAAIIARSTAEQLAGSHPKLDVTTTVDDCPAERALVDLSTDAGMVVVGTRGRGAFEGMLLGSVSHAVIHGSRCAVAVV